MPDLREAFRLSTDHVAPDPGALERQLRRQRARTIKRKVSAFAAVAAVLVMIAGLLLATSETPTDDDRIANPAPGPRLLKLDIGTGETVPFPDPSVEMHAFEVSPDGAKLLMGWKEPYAGSGRRRLVIANADGTDPQILGRDALMGTWFPDSRRIAYVGLPPGGDTRQVTVLDTLTGERTVLTDEESDPIDPTVSPDGRTIVYAVSIKDPAAAENAPVGDEPGANVADVPPRSWLREVAVDGTSPPRDVTMSADTHLWWPDVGATGDLVWVSGRFQYFGRDDVSQMMIRAADGTERVLIAADGDSIAWVDAPVWSPDGSLLAYARGDPDDSQRVWIYQPATGEHREVGAGWPETWFDENTVLVHTD
jgi:Tol biopolymer transport system component